MRLVAFFCICLIAASAKAEDDLYGKTQLICNARSSFLHIGDSADSSGLNARAAVRKEVTWGSLLIIGPETNSFGDRLRTGSRTSVHHCGRFKVRFRSGYVNPNPQGELGAIEFGVVEILMGKKVILPPTALERCDVALTRYKHFGICPDAWATNISVKWNANTSKAQVTLVRSYFDEAYEETTRVDEREAP